MSNRPFPSSVFAVAGPPDLGPGPRAGVLSEGAVRTEATDACPGSPEFLALALLWHDHHSTAHELVQSGENRDGNYVHAILHRREPDYWNSKYWFRRVGRHPVFAPLGRRVNELLQERGRTQLTATLAPGGQWDPLAFVDACEAASAGRSQDAELLREIQQVEFELIAEHLLESRSR